MIGLNRKGGAEAGVIAILCLAVTLLLLVLLGMPIKIAIAVVVGFVVFFISIINTDIALIILIFSMLLSPEFVTGETVGRHVKVRVDDIFIIIIFMGWLAKMAINKELGLLRATRLNTPIMVYIVICLIATFFGILAGRTNVKSAFFYLFKYVEYFLLFFMVSNNLKTVRQAKKFIFFLLLTCFFVCLYAGSQIPAGERVSAPFESAESGEPNTFAGYLVLMMSLMIGFILYPESVKQRMALLALLGIAGVVFLMTLSRSGWLSFFPAVLTFIILCKEYRIPLIILVVVAGIMLPIVAPQKVQRRVEETFTAYKQYKVMGGKIGVDESAAVRIDSWGVGLRRWSNRPIFGYGIPAGAVIDNQYTRVLNETGIIGFAVFMWLLFTIFRAAWGTYTTMENDRFARAASMGFLAGYFGLLLLSCAAAAFIIIRIMEPFWFLVAIVVTLPELKQDGQAAQIEPA